MVAQRVKRLPAVREAQIRSPGWEDPLEKEMKPSPVFLARESQGQRSLVGYSPCGRTELDMIEATECIHTHHDSRSTRGDKQKQDSFQRNHTLLFSSTVY